jgi:hypothetical protein
MNLLHAQHSGQCSSAGSAVISWTRSTRRAATVAFSEALHITHPTNVKALQASRQTAADCRRRAAMRDELMFTYIAALRGTGFEGDCTL